MSEVKSHYINIGNCIDPIVLLSLFFLPLIFIYKMFSRDINRELILVGAMFLMHFTMKFVDAIVDDDLRPPFRGSKNILAIIMAVLAVGQIIFDDFSCTYFCGLTLDCIISGKLDCPQFQLSGALFSVMYLIRYKSSGNFTYHVSDMLAIAAAGAIEERLHDQFAEMNAAGKKLPNYIYTFMDSRFFSVVTLVPFFLWRGYPFAVPMLLAQISGYEIGAFITTKALKRQQE